MKDAEEKEREKRSEDEMKAAKEEAMIKSVFGSILI